MFFNGEHGPGLTDSQNVIEILQKNRSGVAAVFFWPGKADPNSDLTLTLNNP